MRVLLLACTRYCVLTWQREFKSLPLLRKTLITSSAPPPPWLQINLITSQSPISKCHHIVGEGFKYECEGDTFGPRHVAKQQKTWNELKNWWKLPPIRIVMLIFNHRCHRYMVPLFACLFFMLVSYYLGFPYYIHSFYLLWNYPKCCCCFSALTTLLEAVQSQLIHRPALSFLAVVSV